VLGQLAVLFFMPTQNAGRPSFIRALTATDERATSALQTSVVERADRLGEVANHSDDWDVRRRGGVGQDRGEQPSRPVGAPEAGASVRATFCVGARFTPSACAGEAVRAQLLGRLLERRVSLRVQRAKRRGRAYVRF
jgi:hypothetical protein